MPICRYNDAAARSRHPGCPNPALLLSPRHNVLTTPRILVIGNAMPEQVRRAETGATALRLGGVGAITARELLRCGLRAVTLLAPVSSDAPGRTAQELLRQQPYAVIAAPARATVGYTRVLTTAGEPRELDAVYPTIAWAEIGPAAVEALASPYDWVAADCNLDADALAEIARRAPPGRLVINGTAPDRCDRILTTAAYPKAAVTLNRREAAVLYRIAGADDADALRRRLNSQWLLVTRDAAGWLLANAGRVSRHPAAPVPPDTDFIGAGDSATAGLLYALASGRPPAPEIAAAIARRLEYNRLPAL